MNQRFIAKVTKDHNLETPPEVKSQLKPESEYEMIFKNDDIILKRITHTSPNQSPPNLRRGSGKSFLRHSGTWKGNDFEQCLEYVYSNRSQIEI